MNSCRHLANALYSASVMETDTDCCLHLFQLINPAPSLIIYILLLISCPLGKLASLNHNEPAWRSNLPQKSNQDPWPLADLNSLLTSTMCSFQGHSTCVERIPTTEPAISGLQQVIRYITQLIMDLYTALSWTFNSWSVPLTDIYSVRLNHRGVNWLAVSHIILQQHFLNVSFLIQLNSVRFLSFLNFHANEIFHDP